MPVLKKLFTPKSSKGFTLIELLVAITILGVISTIGFVSYSESQKIARDSRRKQDLRRIQTALELYKQSQPSTPKTYPTTGANSSSGSSTWITGLATTHINIVPSDPLNTGSNIYTYYTADLGVTYQLCAKLEVSEDTEGQKSGCGTSSIYLISSP